MQWIGQPSLKKTSGLTSKKMHLASESYGDLSEIIFAIRASSWCVCDEASLLVMFPNRTGSEVGICRSGTYNSGRGVSRRTTGEGINPEAKSAKSKNKPT